MQMKRFFVVLISMSCMQLLAMDLENMSDGGVQLSASEKKVCGVVVQYQPGYTVSKLFAQLPPAQQEEHYQKLMEVLQVLNNPARESSGSRIINLSYFRSQADLGIYYLQFAKPTSWDLVHGLVKDLPGFEALHDIQVFEKSELGLKDNLLKARLALLDLEAKACTEKNKQQEEMRVRKEQDMERRTAQLMAYKVLSSGQKTGLFKSVELIAAK